jgi:hypothetical protein
MPAVTVTGDGVRYASSPVTYGLHEDLEVTWIMGDELMAKSAPATSPSGLERLGHTDTRDASSGNVAAAWSEYMVDAIQRSILFLGLLRERDHEAIEITARPMATVRCFNHETPMCGRSLPRPKGVSRCPTSKAS